MHVHVYQCTEETQSKILKTAHTQKSTVYHLFLESSVLKPEVLLIQRNLRQDRRPTAAGADHIPDGSLQSVILVLQILVLRS